MHAGHAVTLYILQIVWASGAKLDWRLTSITTVNCMSGTNNLFKSINASQLVSAKRNTKYTWEFF